MTRQMTIDRAVELLTRIGEEASGLSSADDTKFSIFRDKSSEIFKSIFGVESWRYKRFSAIEWTYNPSIWMSGMDFDTPNRQTFRDAVRSTIALVEDSMKDLNSGEEDIISTSPKKADIESKEGFKIFLTHGISNDWTLVQRFIENRLGIPTIELAEMLSRGRTIIEKLEAASDECFYAVIVMTGDDIGNKGVEISPEEASARVRENVMHEIGFFQGLYGRSNVILLHENGVSIPSNLQGIVYEEFPKGYISATFEKLREEIEAAKKDLAE